MTWGAGGVRKAPLSKATTATARASSDRNSIWGLLGCQPWVDGWSIAANRSDVRAMGGANFGVGVAREGREL